MTIMAIIIFDLDDTLIAGDSDHAWGQFVVERGIVHSTDYQKANDQFFSDYQNGCLNLHAYLEFVLQPLSQHSIEQLYQWREEFIDNKIKPIVLKKAHELIKQHKNVGDLPIIITSTNRFITEPIAQLFCIEHLIATEPEIKNGRYTGRYVGTPSFQDGKVTRLQNWLNENNHSLSGSYAYSDSYNDVSLLNFVDTPVAVDPDQKLAEYAKQKGWNIISLRDNE